MAPPQAFSMHRGANGIIDTLRISLDVTVLGTGRALRAAGISWVRGVTADRWPTVGKSRIPRAEWLDWHLVTRQPAQHLAPPRENRPVLKLPESSGHAAGAGLGRSFGQPRGKDAAPRGQSCRSETGCCGGGWTRSSQTGLTLARQEGEG